MQITKDLTLKDIEIKQYIPLIEKHLIVTKIIDSSIKIDANNIYYIDYFYKYFTTQLSLIRNYTDLDFTEEAINDFDCLAELGLVEDIINQIPDSEVNFIVSLVDNELDQMVKINNSLENIVNQKSKQLIEVVEQKLQQFIDRVPDSKQLKSLSKSLVKDINKMDWDKVPMLKQMWQTANFKQGESNG